MRSQGTASEEGLPAFEELFLYACPKFIAANPPPYEEGDQLAMYMEAARREGLVTVTNGLWKLQSK